MASTVEATTRRRFRAPLLVVGGLAVVALLGVGVFQGSGRAAFDQAQRLGRAVTSDPDSLFDQEQIAAEADALGVRISFSSDFQENGQVVVRSLIPQASVCLYLPSTAGWAFGVGDEPCDDPSPRGGPQAVDPAALAGMGIAGPAAWAEPGNPLVYDTETARAVGYGDVYVQNPGPGEEVVVTVDGRMRVDGAPGTTAYFEAGAQVPCDDAFSDCQYRDVAGGRSQPTSSARAIGATATVVLPEDTRTVRAAVRLCLDLPDSREDLCTGWNYAPPIDVPPAPR